jgi:hypothetical protein
MSGTFAVYSIASMVLHVVAFRRSNWQGVVVSRGASVGVGGLQLQVVVIIAFPLEMQTSIYDIGRAFMAPCRPSRVEY